jgi:hypothetical protein
VFRCSSIGIYADWIDLGEKSRQVGKSLAHSAKLHSLCLQELRVKN